MRHVSPRLPIAVAAAAVIFIIAAASLPAQERYQERAIGGVGITVYRDENFRGENATFRSDVPDLRRFGLNDRITSLSVAPGEYWEGCEGADYQGRCQLFSGEERDLGRVGWSDKISSLRRVRRGGGGTWPGPNPAYPGTGKYGIILYDEPLFRGRSVTIKDPVENLRQVNFHDRAESARVVSGSWEICAEPNFRRCQTVDRDVAYLANVGLNKRLSSIRPVGWGPGDGGPGPYPDDARLVLFEDPGYRGRSVVVDSSTAVVTGLGNRVGSVQVISGRWLVCERQRFQGRCQEISSSVPDLDRWGFRDRIRSARPVDGY